MKFLLDMNLSPRWEVFLADMGYTVKHWSDVGPHDAPDRDTLDFAHMHGWVVITHDLDLGYLLAIGGRTLPSVIQLRTQAMLPGDVGSILHKAIQASSSYIAAGALITVTPATHRVSILPIRQIGLRASENPKVGGSTPPQATQGPITPSHSCSHGWPRLQTAT